MEQAKRRTLQSLLAHALAAAVLVLGLLMMSGAFTRSRQVLVDSEDGRLMEAAQSVDNDITGRFAAAGDGDRVLLLDAGEQMALCAVVIMTGAVLLLLFLMRSGRSRQKARNEAALLRARTEAMEALNAQTQALAHRQRLETIGTLASGIAHEFNNLLTPSWATAS